MARNKQELLETGSYIYLYHIDELIYLPVYPESISDTLQSTFNQTNALSRSAPNFTYSYSGPRSMQFQFILHRDLLDEVNKGGLSNATREVGEDYVDAMIRKIQAVALPSYQDAKKAVNPPMVAVRIGAGEDIFIKGVVNGGVTVSYAPPIMSNGQYAVVTIGFTVYEIDPYDAETVSKLGSFRGISRAFKDMIYSKESANSFNPYAKGGGGGRGTQIVRRD